MKKLIYLFLTLFTAITYGQADFPEGVQISGGQPTVTSVNFLTTTDNTLSGLQGKIAPINLPIPYAPVNYSISNQSIGQHLSGIDTRLGQISSTTAGITQRVYFTADNTIVNAVTYFASSLTGKGSTATGSPPALVLGDNTKAYFTKDVISIAQPSATIAYGGTYSGNLTVSATPTPIATQQRFTVEIYRTNNLGVPIASGVSGAPTGDLGVTVLAILDSGIINLSAGSITNVPVSGILTQNVTINTGERIRYHVSAAKIGSGGGSVTFGVYYGTSYNSYYDIPVAIRTNGVLDDSDVAGAVTATDALNTLNGALIYKRTIAQIRALTGTLPSNNFYTTDSGKEGEWYYDSTDTTTADNTGTVLVTSDGKRIKRIFKGGASIRWFGAVPDGITDSRIAIQNAINASKDVFVPIGTFYVSGTINLLNKTNLTGAGIGSILYSKDGDYPVLEVTAVDISVRDLAITGDGRGTLTNYSTVRPNNNGIQIIGNYPTSSYSSIILENLTLNNLGNAGLYIRNNQSNNFTPTVLATNINAGVNLVGFYLDTKAEYSSFTNCASNRNEYGTLINGGNNNFTGGSITNNRTGVYIGAGANDGHSVFSAVAINHNIEYSVHAKDILYGYLFSGCMLYYGDIWLDNSDMVKFVDCDMYTPNVYANSSNKIEFKGNKWTLTPTLILNFMGHPSDVRFIDNFITDGSTNTTVTNSKFIGTVSGQPATVNTEFVTKAQLDAAAVPGVKRYKALISQTGTSAPTVIVLENTTGETITWTRTGTGLYTGTFTGTPLTNLKTSVIIGSTTPSTIGKINRGSTNAINVSAFTYTTGAGADNALAETMIEIQIYP